MRKLDYNKKGLIEILVYLCVINNLVMGCWTYSNITGLKSAVQGEFQERIEANESEIARLVVSNASKDTQLTRLESTINDLELESLELEKRLCRLEGSYPFTTVYDLARIACQEYDDIDPCFVLAVARLESGFNPTATNGEAIGLMQITPRWFTARAERLGVTDYEDPYGNLLLGVDYLHEIHQQLIKDTGKNDWRYVLMVYNMGYNTATSAYQQGIITEYANTVLEYYAEYKRIESLLGVI